MQNTYIDQYIKLLTDYFFKNKSDTSFKLENIENLTDYFKNSQRELSNFKEKGFLSLSKSILSGEYILWSEDHIKKLKERLSSIDSEIDFHFSEVKSSNKDQIIQQIINVLPISWHAIIEQLVICLNHYDYLVGIANAKMDISNTNEKSIQIFTQNEEAEDLFNIITSTVIPLCVFDYKPPVQEEEIIRLFEIREGIDKNTIPNINNIDANIRLILLHKSNFLVRKISKESEAQLLVGSEKQKLDILNLEIGEFSDFAKKENLFKDQKSQSYLDLKQIEQNIHNKSENFSDYISLMRYYNRLNNYNREKADFIINKFEENILITEDWSNYDKHAYNTTINYLFNSRFAIICGDEIQKQCTLELLKKDLSDISSLQDDTKIYNYHPFEKAFCNIKERIKTSLKDDNTKDKLIDKKIKLLENYLIEFEKAVYWCESKNFFFFQLKQAESTIEYEITDNQTGQKETLKVLVPTTFSRIIDFKKLTNSILEYKTDMNVLKGRIEIQKDIQKDKKEIEKIKEETKNSQKRAFELLGIFTTIITFLFGTISFAASSTNNTYTLISNTLALGSVLLIFVSILLIISPYYIYNNLKKDFLKSTRFIFLIILIIASIAMLFLIY